MIEGDAVSCVCTGDAERAERDPAYRRALWWVVVLNIGFGLCELLGGFIANSQALKADSLDFIGDGSITFVGLLALGWSAGRRAHVAMAQGWFLVALGIRLIGMAAWRALNAVPPEAELMGGIGIAALVVNVSAALILSRFREGDSNVRAVWLFSRNDALANIAVIIAALLVFGLDSAGPDLRVAGAISLLCLQSAREIVQRARAEIVERTGK